MEEINGAYEDLLDELGMWHCISEIIATMLYTYRNISRDRGRPTRADALMFPLVTPGLCGGQASSLEHQELCAGCNLLAGVSCPCENF